VSKCDKILAKARRSAANLRFDEALVLAECLGFEHARTRGSHRIFKHEGSRTTLNLQPDKRDPSKAKKRQVEELVRLHDDLGFP
jgi:predicted RNA binding protein YcfA (HicA-like mRNA interferase family)